jgi:flagellar motor switch protein FliG
VKTSNKIVEVMSKKDLEELKRDKEVRGAEILSYLHQYPDTAADLSDTLTVMEDMADKNIRRLAQELANKRRITRGTGSFEIVKEIANIFEAVTEARRRRDNARILDKMCQSYSDVCDDIENVEAGRPCLQRYED